MANSYGMMVPAILATLKQKESGGNYTIRAKNASASGAYQFTDPTWRSVTRKYGVGTEYPHAYMAPPQVQDEVARRQVTGLLQQGYGPKEVANVWYTGNPQGKLSASAIALNNGLTADRYNSDFMRKFEKNSALGYSNPSQMDTSPGNMDPAGFTPNTSPSEPGLPSLVGSPMPDTSGGAVGDPMAAPQGGPDYMAQFSKLAGSMGGGGGGGGGQAPAPQLNWDFSWFRPQGPKQVQPVQVAPFGKRRGLLG